MAEIRKLVFLSTVWILDTLDAFLQYFGIKLLKLTPKTIYKSLTPEELEESRKPDVVVPFQKFIKGFEEDKVLTLFRRFMEKMRIKGALSVRVEHENLFKEKPEILQIPIRRPVFIASLPRTGTTFLSRLMGADPRLHAPPLWQMAFPSILHRTDNPRESSLFKKLMFALEMDTWQRGEGMNRIHVVGPDEPEECILFTRLSFYASHDMMRLPSFTEYRDWFYSSDHTFYQHMYKHYKKNLQILSHKLEDRRFLLKCHLHLMDLQALLETFPDACIIHNVRPMADVLASVCSTFDQTFNYYGPVDDQFGKRMLRMFAELTNRAIKTFRQFNQLPEHENPLFIVDYKELVRDPLTMIKKIYTKFRIEMTDGAVQRLQKYIDTHPQNKFGRHEYSLEKYGLTMEDVQRELKPYQEYMASIGYTDVI